MVGPRGRARGYITKEEIKGDQIGIVSEYIDPIPGTIHENDNLHDAVSQMYVHASDWLPVVDDDGPTKATLPSTSLPACSVKRPASEAIKLLRMDS